MTEPEDKWWLDPRRYPPGSRAEAWADLQAAARIVKEELRKVPPCRLILAFLDWFENLKSK